MSPDLDRGAVERRRRRSAWAALPALLVLPALLLAAACGDGAAPAGPDDADGPDPAARLTTDVLGQAWLLEAFVDDADSSIVPAVVGPRATLRFDADGTVAGDGGCNTFGGTWRVGADERLEVGPLAATKKACAEPAGLMEQEARYLRALAEAHDVQRAADILRVDYGDAGRHLRLSLIVREQAPPEPFTQMWWQLDLFERIDGDAVTPTPALRRAPPTLFLNEDGRAYGNTGCNDWGALWSQPGPGRIAFTELAYTEMACAEPDGVMRQEARFLDALAAADRFGSEPERLWMQSGDGADGLSFVPAATATPTPAEEDTVWLAGGARVRWRPDACSVFFAPPEPYVVGRARAIDAAYVLSTYCNASDAGALRLRPVVDGDRVTLNVVYAGDPVRCTCTIPWHASIEGLEPGRYTVRLAFAAQAGQVPEVLDERVVDVPAPGRVRAIRGGTSFGECMGYCWEELTLTDAGMRLVEGGWDRDAFPERSIADSVTAELWARLTGLEDTRLIHDLDARIGCPDCADGGAEWVEVETAAGRKRVTFEHGTPPKGLQQLAGALESLRARLRDELGTVTAVIETR